VLLSWMPATTGRHDVSRWDESTRRFAPLGSAGAGESTFLLAAVTRGHYRFRVCRLEGDVCVAPSVVDVDVGS
jgi:hypothetical protein